MAFKDYSITPASNTLLGDGTYIGPNMLRNKVRPAFQQIAADGRGLYDELYGLIGGIPAGPPGDVGAAADREALSLIAGTSGATVRILAESGNEDVFRYYTDAEFLARYGITQAVATGVDTERGMFVGASGGAWARQFSGPINVRWFGAVANDAGTGAFGTDSYPAIAAAFAVAQALAIAAYINGTIYRGGPSVLIPKGGYYSSQSLAPLFTGKIYGDGGKGWGAATRIRFPAGVDGLQLQAHNTSGKTTLDGVTHFAGDRLHISDIAFLGAYNGTESDTHGIRGKRAGTIERCTFDGFEGDGFYCNTTFNSGVGSTEGNTNAMRVIDCEFTNCRRGRYCEGNDANAITFIGCSYINNRQAGIAEDSYLGNHEFGPHIDGNARTADNTGTAAKPASYTSIGGYQFFVIRGQEAGAATNAPKSSTVTITIASPGVVSWTAHGLAAGTEVAFATTGALPTGLVANTAYFVVNPGANDFQVAATAGGAAINTSGSQSGVHTSGAGKDNTWWGAWTAGGPSASAPAYTSGLTWRAGGPVLHDGASNSSSIFGAHIESNGVSQIDQGMTMQGTLGQVVKVSGGVLTRDAASTDISSSEGRVLGGQVVARGSLWAGAATNTIGPYRGATVQDGVTRFGSRNATHSLEFDIFDAASAPTKYAEIAAGPGFGASFDMMGAANFWRFRIAGNERFKVDNAGAIITGGALYNGANQVLGARKTGWATATGTATRTTFDTATVTLPQLAERLKALIDDFHSTAGHGAIGP